ncbi:glycosyl hydrolase family 28-related protein [Bacillus sp. MUM 13]|uniref:glycosyl hydrolase family 28-related protein n=1 Tax=Bacillus sp. MUM 13 TaxID=1678001 RepID=UPI0008F5D41D|nr:glycosyl hydrolase family 28-related protein [Bacillus sp. MUM 13]OIK12704.1 pectate lyase [Bacillus sp. MUM 13]
MIDLGKNHDSRKNRELLSELFGTQLNAEKAVQETNKLFQKHKNMETRISKLSFMDKAKGLLAKLTGFSHRGNDTEMNEGLFPEWKNKLDKEYNALIISIKKEVNVLDYGAVGDGVTDCTQAFKKALGSGKVKVVIPKGTYITKGIKLPSWTILTGQGEGETIVKLHDRSPRGNRLITNKNHTKGNRNILVENMTLNWNAERLPADKKTSSGNNRSSCLTFANVTYGWTRNIVAINPGLHCFDVSSTKYTYLGDGTKSPGRSRYIWIDHVHGYGFGDDGITTHHSDNILITNSHLCDPSGRAHQKGFSNSNGIEVDDGSTNVWLMNNSTARCFGGVEVKAHHNASAAANVTIIGHLSVNDNRSYNFRHIGHHKEKDPESKTAYNIRATLIVSLAPVFTDLYKDSNPRGMVISAYKNVAINHFLLIGNSEYDYKQQPVIAIQYRARNVVLSNITINGFNKASSAIKIFGGEQKADHITIGGVYYDRQGTKPVVFGKDIENISINDIKPKDKKELVYI